MGNSKNSNIVVGLDIGTSKVVCIVGTRDENGQLEIISLGSYPSSGLKKGVVVNIEATTDAIKKAMDLELECQLVNCVHADTGSLAIEKLKGLKNLGIYANSSVYKKNELEGFISDSDEWHYHNHQPIDHVHYNKYVNEWI